MPPLSTSPSVHGLPWRRMRASQWYLAGSLSAAQTPMSAEAAASSDVRLVGRVHQIADEQAHFQVGPAFLEPALGEDRLAFADGGERKQMAFDIVRLVDVRLDQRDARDPRIAANHVEHRHPAAARADLDEMGHTFLHRQLLRAAA